MLKLDFLMQKEGKKIKRMKTAVVIGASGLTGSYLVDLLLKDERFTKVLVFARHRLEKYHPKLEEYVINFERPSEWKHLVKGDVLFSALGTTIKKAVSKEVQFKVDYTYQYQFAKTASQNGIPVYVLVSSASADPNSHIFYMKMKGELERDIKKLPFQRIHILQPGLLEGERKERRPLEIVTLKIAKALNSIGILKHYKPVHGKIVAQRMVKASFSQIPGLHTYALTELFNIRDN
jgi:uncharacterized protein YbjT (DUF2867 family)